MMDLLLVAVAAFAGTMIAVLLLQTVGKRGQVELIETASRTAVAKALAQVRAGVNRLEESGVRVEAASAVVAEDLAAAHDRADAAHDGIPGEAADAASRSPDDA